MSSIVLREVGYRGSAGQVVLRNDAPRRNSEIPCYLLQCGFCETAYGAEGDVDVCECPMCERGTPRVRMREEQYIEGVLAEAEDTVDLLSSRRKVERERMVCAAFLRCLGVEFDALDIMPGTCEPVDVAFRAAQFQIMEILEPGRQRHGEWKKKLNKYRDATTIDDFIEPYHPSANITIAEVLVRITEGLARKKAKYGRCSELDALVYVNLSAHLTKPVMIDGLDEVQRQGWRSVSFVQVPYSCVLLAEPSAPDILRDRVGGLLAKWGSMSGYFVL